MYRTGFFLNIQRQDRGPRLGLNIKIKEYEFQKDMAIKFWSNDQDLPDVNGELSPAPQHAQHDIHTNYFPLWGQSPCF